MSTTGGGIVVHANVVTPVTRNGKTLNVNNTRDSDVSFDEDTICTLVDTLGDADGVSQMTI